MPGWRLILTVAFFPGVSISPTGEYATVTFSIERRMWISCPADVTRNSSGGVGDVCVCSICLDEVRVEEPSEGDAIVLTDLHVDNLWSFADTQVTMSGGRGDGMRAYFPRRMLPAGIVSKVAS